MPTLWDLMTQYSLVLTGNCPLDCSHCSLWQEDQSLTHTKIEALQELLEDRRFFEHYPKRRVYNILGGDPALYPFLSLLLSTLKKEGIYTRFWSPGLGTDFIWDQILGDIDSLILYCPSGDRDSYLDLSGHDHFLALSQRLSYFKESVSELLINYPVTTASIPYLPEIYDLVFDEKIDLLLHLEPNAGLSKEEKQFVLRFTQLPETIFLHPFPRPKFQCQAYPLPVNTKIWQSRYMGFQEYYQRCRQRFHPYFFLKRTFG